MRSNFKSKTSITMNTQSIIDHIRATTPKGYRNRRRPRPSRLFAISAGILIGLAAITFLSA